MLRFKDEAWQYCYFQKNRYINVTLFLGYTLISWLHKISIIIRTLTSRLKKNNTLKCSFYNFPGITCVSNSDFCFLQIYFNLSLFFNPGDKVLKGRKTKKKICPIFSKIIRTCYSWKSSWTTFQYMIVLLLRGQRPNYCWNFM